VIRHKLVDMRMRLEAVKANLDVVTWKVSNKLMPIAEVCMLKNFACTALEWIANESMQIFGGAGYLRGAKVERIYRETKVLSIGGGSIEIMKELASKQLGL
jgi:acyl-CoA dehydrogenase